MPPLSPVRRAFRVVEQFFASWRFPAFALSALLFFTALLAAALLAPAATGPLAAFAEEFRIWCFGFDPSAGRYELVSLLTTFIEPLVLAGVVTLLWWKPLRELAQRPSQLLPYAGSALLLVSAAAAALAFGGGSSAPSEKLPFPAERLRTAHLPPEIRLTNQDGAAVSLEALHGKVVMLTGVYSSCGYTCPMIMSQAKRAVSGLTAEERADLSVVAITLDPERDDQKALSAMARAQGVRAPLFQLVTGEPGRVNAALDALGIVRSRDPATGVIDHANLFLLVDRKGRIAYRFSLGSRQQEWLATALRLLIQESAKP